VIIFSWTRSSLSDNQFTCVANTWNISYWVFVAVWFYIVDGHQLSGTVEIYITHVHAYTHTHNFTTTTPAKLITRGEAFSSPGEGVQPCRVTNVGVVNSGSCWTSDSRPYRQVYCKHDGGLFMVLIC